MVAFIYPAFFSIRALESMRPRELEKWLTYWVVFAFVNLGEMISDNLLWWFPYYWFMKVCAFATGHLEDCAAF